jgi:hypothetical protein
MSTLSITNINDWYTAIGDSHQATPSYTTYLLTTNLTFTNTNPPYLTSTTTPSGSNGTVDTDYLYITVGQTFNGQGYVLTVNSGCEPVAGLSGIFRARGVSGNVANIVYISINGGSGLIWNTTAIGSLFLSSLSSSYDPEYVNIQYGTFQLASSLNTDSCAWVLNHKNRANYITIDSVYMNLTGLFTNNATSFIMATNFTLTNCIFQCSVLNGARDCGFITNFSSGPTIVSDCYFLVASSTASNPSIILEIDGSLTLSNIYIVCGNTYSSVYTSTSLYLINYNRGSGTVTNLYNNAQTFTVTRVQISGTPLTQTNVVSSYTWATAPTFSNPSAWINSVSPYLLSVFQNDPFNSSVYTLYNLAPAFLAPPICFNSGTLILCYGPIEDIWKPVESLKKGDLVKTYLYGYRRIDTIISSEIENNCYGLFECMYRLPKTKDMTEDLIVTGGHSIMEDELPQEVLEMYEMNNWFNRGKDSMIDGKYMVLACLSDKFEKVMTKKKFQIYHFALENDGDKNKRYLVWANHVLTETPSKAYLQMENHEQPENKQNCWEARW